MSSVGGKKGDEEAHAMDENYITAFRAWDAPARGLGIRIDQLEIHTPIHQGCDLFSDAQRLMEFKHR